MAEREPSQRAALDATLAITTAFPPESAPADGPTPLSSQVVGGAAGSGPGEAGLSSGTSGRPPVGKAGAAPFRPSPASSGYTAPAFGVTIAAQEAGFPGAAHPSRVAPVGHADAQSQETASSPVPLNAPVERSEGEDARDDQKSARLPSQPPGAASTPIRTEIGAGERPPVLERVKRSDAAELGAPTFHDAAVASPAAGGRVRSALVIEVQFK